MKLPNPEQAIVEMQKLTGYCLSFEHSDGRHKAYVFRSALGLTIDNAEELRSALLEAVQRYDAIVGKSNLQGQKYVIEFPMTRMNQTATIRTGWIIRHNEDFPRLVTCYIVRK